MDRGRAKEEEPDHYTQSYNVHCNGNSPQWIHSLSIFRCLYTCSAKWIWIKYRQYTISTLNSVVENHLNVQSGSGRSAVLVVLNSIPECLHRFCDTCMKIFSSAALNAQLTELGSLTGEDWGKISYLKISEVQSKWFLVRYELGKRQWCGARSNCKEITKRNGRVTSPGRTERLEDIRFQWDGASAHYDEKFENR